MYLKLVVNTDNTTASKHSAESIQFSSIYFTHSKFTSQKFSFVLFSSLLLHLSNRCLPELIHCKVLNLFLVSHTQNTYLA